MIDVCISHGFGEDNRYHQNFMPEKIQLAVYKYSPFMENKESVAKQITENNIQVKVVHLPLDTLRRNAKDIHKLITFCNNELKAYKFVIHPNKNVFTFIDYFLKNVDRYNQLCIETFAWKVKKAIRSPLEIIEICSPKFPRLAMTLDTSHIEQIWFDHRILPMLLKYTTVIHLSNRAKGFGQHLPFNSPNGDLNLVSFVRSLKHTYHWTGSLVLEYMPEYQNKLIKNKNYIERLLT